MLAVHFEAITDENAAMIGLERPVIDFELDGPQLRPVHQRDEFQLRRIFLPQLLQQIRFDHTRRNDIFQKIDMLAGDVGPVQIVDLHRARRLGVGHLANDVDESVTDVAGNRAHQIREEERRAFEDAEEEDLCFTGVFADAFAELGDAAGDLFLAEFLLDAFLQ